MNAIWDQIRHVENSLSQRLTLAETSQVRTEGVAGGVAGRGAPQGAGQLTWGARGVAQVAANAGLARWSAQEEGMLRLEGEKGPCKHRGHQRQLPSLL